MTHTPLPTELVYLAWSVVLLMAQIALQALSLTSELGRAYNVGPRDEARQVKGRLAGRAARALKNLLETYPAFIALALALAVSGRTGGWAAIGAGVWFWARAVYVPIYLLGIPMLRTTVWSVSLLGLLAMVRSLLFAG